LFNFTDEQKQIFKKVLEAVNYKKEEFYFYMDMKA